MPTMRRSFILIGTALSVSASVLGAQSALSHVADSLIATGFEGVILSGDASGRRIGITKGRARRTPVLEHTEGRAWPWASVTKQVTAVLVMMEVERGSLALSSTVGDVLPQFRNASARGITIRQLLQHTSALPNPDAGTPDDRIPAAWSRPRPRGRAVDEANLLCSAPVTGPAGRTFDYNNCDYLVLGAVLEARTGQSFATLVRTRLSEPLRLSSVRLMPPTPEHQPTILGYRGTHPAPRPNVATYGAAGALTGTPDDLLQFDLALMRGAVLQRASLKELWDGAPSFGYAALGAWAFPATLAGCAEPVDLVERRGDIGGIQVRNLLAPARQQALIIFTNRGDYEFGEIWQQRGATWALASAAFCGA